MKRIRSVAVVLAMVVGTMFTLASTSAGASSAGATPVKGKTLGTTIKIVSFAYKPNLYVASPGEVIRVVNIDGQRFGAPHSLTANDGSFDTGIFIIGKRFITAPTAPGKYPWFCEIHRFMYGELVVPKSGA